MKDMKYLQSKFRARHVHGVVILLKWVSVFMASILNDSPEPVGTILWGIILDY